MAPAAGAAATDGTDRRPGRSAGHMHAVAAGNDPPNGFTRLRINPQRLVFHALPHFEASHRFRRISGFVNVGWHNEIYSAACRLGASFGSAAFSSTALPEPIQSV